RMRDTLGHPVVFAEVAFTHDAPPSRAAHDAFFGVAARFGQPRDVLGFSADLLELPLRTASGCLAQLLAARFREIEPAAEDPFAARVRRAIVDLLDAGDCRLTSAAERLRVSARTLQRRLATLGTSHRDLLDDVRRERSLHLLRASELSVTQV